MAEYPYGFRSLIVWQKSQGLALEIARLVAGLPRDSVASVLGRQIMASAASIGANIAEGYGRYAVGAYCNHLSIARGSACETDGWLDLPRRTGYLDAATESKPHQQCLELIRMLTAKILALDRQRAGTSAIREAGPLYDAPDYADGAPP